MTVTSEVPGSLEGDEILLTGLNIRPTGRPIRKCGFDKPVFPVSVERGKCTGEITKESDPLVRHCDENSKIDLGAKIIGKHLWGFCSTLIKPIKGGKGKTARHTGQEGVLKKNCYLCLIHGQWGDALSIHPSSSTPAKAIMEADF